MKFPRMLKLLCVVTCPTLLEKPAEMFFQEETENSKIFFLASELWMLGLFCWYLDGTFSVIRNSKFCQTYIISILVNENDKTFSYPIGSESARPFLYLEFYISTFRF